MNKQQRKRNAEEQAEWLFRRHKNANLLARPGCHELVLVLDNLKSDFNIGKIFRSADAFGACEVHLIGIERFNPSSAKGSFKWVPAKFHRDFKPCHDELIARGYSLFVLEPGAAATLSTVELPRKSAFILGHEEFGIQFDKTFYPTLRGLSIPQFGRVQSLNVSVAASIVMYDYIRQHAAQHQEQSESAD